MHQLNEQLAEACRISAIAAAAEFHRLQAQGEALPLPEWVSTQQCAALTGISPHGLENLRAKREGPPYAKIGKSVRYEVAAVRAWLRERIVQP